MIIKATLKPGQNGTKRLMEKYGNRLVCVRYRYDEHEQKRYTTVELIEHASEWETIQPRSSTQPNPLSQRLAMQIEYWESELRQRVKHAGGIWRPRQQLWEMRHEDVVALRLEARVVGEDALCSEETENI